MFGRFAHARGFKEAFFCHGPGPGGHGGGGHQGPNGCHQGHGQQGGVRPPWSSTNIKEQVRTTEKLPKRCAIPSETFAFLQADSGCLDEDDKRRGCTWHRGGRRHLCWNGESVLSDDEVKARQCPVSAWIGVVKAGSREVPWASILAAGIHTVVGNNRLESERFARLRRRGFFGHQSVLLGALPIAERADKSLGIAASAHDFRVIGEKEIAALLLDGKEEAEVARVEPKARKTSATAALVEDTAAESRPESRQETSKERIESACSLAERDLMEAHDRLTSAVEADLGLQLLLAGHADAGMRLLKSAAASGNAEAAHNVGVAYQERGRLKKAAKYYRRAAEADYAPALINLSLFYRRGMGGVERNRTEAERLMERAKNMQDRKTEEKEAEERAGDDRGLGASSEMPGRGGGGDPESVYLLARAYHYGLSGCPEDKHYALALYREATERGHAQSKSEHEALKRELYGIREEAAEDTKLQPGERQEEEQLTTTTILDEDEDEVGAQLQRRVSGDSGLGALEAAYT